MKVSFIEIPSPMGPLTLGFVAETLCAVSFDEYWEPTKRQLERTIGTVTKAPRITLPMKDVCRRLEDYFAGEIATLDTIPAVPHGTEFQLEVWKALRKIGPGETTSYGELAASIGRPNAQRAVGSANGSNPVAIVIPCHRVIGSSGDLTGYGGGLHRKRWLLAHEGFPIQGELNLDH